MSYLLAGTVQTVWLSAATVSLGTVLGLALGLISVAGCKLLAGAITGYIFVLRGIPILVIMFVCYYALPAFGVRAPAAVSVLIGLVLYASAFYTDILRGALLSVPRGQAEAAASLGMRRFPILLHILLPQALRPILAPWLNTSIIMVKSTAYASIVGVWELTYAAREIIERTLALFDIIAGAMLIYFVICFPLSLIARRLETRVAVAH